MLKIYVTVLKEHSVDISYNTPSGCTTISVHDGEDNLTHFAFEGNDDHYQYFLKLKDKFDVEKSIILSIESFEH